ncbi:hypothetical protein TYRP_007099, partial [Tyrophagus putrescentiae]
FGQRLTLTTLGHCERPTARSARETRSVDVHSAQVSSDLSALSFKQRLTLESLGSPKTPADSDLARSAREALVGGRFLVSQVTPDLAVFICATANTHSCLAAAHTDVTWPLSTPSSSGLARCARETLVVDLAALGSALLPARNNCAPPAAQAGNSENGENGSESTQPEPPAVQQMR